MSMRAEYREKLSGLLAADAAAELEALSVLAAAEPQAGFPLLERWPERVRRLSAKLGIPGGA